MLPKDTTPKAPGAGKNKGPIKAKRGGASASSRGGASATSAASSAFPRSHRAAPHELGGPRILDACEIYWGPDDPIPSLAERFNCTGADLDTEA